MAGAEALAAATVGQAVSIGLGESYKRVSLKVESAKNLEDIHDLLDEDLQRLLAIKEDNERQVQRHKQKDITEVYRSWKISVSNIAAEVNKLKDKYERERLPKWRLIRRSNLSNKMAKKHTRVKYLIEQGISINILVDKPSERVLKVLDAPKITGYPTLQSVLEKIVRCLKNQKMKAIGVYGLKGVGKTTILQNLNNNEEVFELFEMVIFITFQNDEKFQQSIANRLKVEVEPTKDSTEVIARKIHEELNDKKFLLIVDEVSGFINLQQLGIPNNDNGSKVVMASESCDVCNMNNMDRLIEAKRLEDDEAWQMFRNIVGPIVNRPGITPTARRVCQRCSRLPLLIHKIGSSFKLKSDAPSWRAALEDLDQRWRERQNDALKELYKFMAFCYGQLQDKHKKCFLYSSLYPPDSKIYTDYLVECWAAQGFLGSIDETRRFQKARDNGRMIIGDLVNVSLLEKGERMMYVTISGCMRQLALHILSEHPQYSSYVQTNEEFEEPLQSNAWVNAKWVSMIDTKLHSLPTSQDCGMLEALLLQKNSELVTIPQMLFENMCNLLVLDLCGTGIKELPSSISELSGLKGLYLNACKYLSKLPHEVGSLQLLEVLDIQGSQVNFLPSCIGRLSNLRCLRVPYIKSGNQNDHQDSKVANSELTYMPHNLEELFIEVISYNEWCSKAENVMEQVASLKSLTTLNCSFPSSNILMCFIARRKQWKDQKQFTSFQFSIGCQNTERPKIVQYFKDGIIKYIRYCNGGKDDVVMGEILSETEAVELISHKDITNLSDLGMENLNNICGFLIESCSHISTIVDGDKISLRSGSVLPNLEQLYLRNLPKLEYVFRGPLSLEAFCQLHTLELENCSSLKSIFNSGGIRNASIFPNLEKLYLKNMSDLKCLFNGPLHPSAFAKLQSLVLENCPSLENIFGNGVILNFSELQKLKVQDCLKIEELIAVSEDNERGKDVLPTLAKLELTNLLNLKFICKSQMLLWSSLEILKIHGCPELASLPFQKDKAVKLKSIKGKQQWWNKLGEADKEVHQQFQDIFVATDG